MTLEQDIKKVDKLYPGFHRWIDLYSQTGLKIYEKMIEFELNIIRQNYGDRIYNEFNNIYQTVKEVQNGRI